MERANLSDGENEKNRAHDLRGQRLLMNWVCILIAHSSCQFCTDATPQKCVLAKVVELRIYLFDSGRGVRIMVAV